MKTKFYFLAMAASVAFAACTNDELDNIKGADIQDAELVALGDVQVNVSKQGVDSRIANGAWESTDEVGVGFTNWYGALAANNFKGNGTAREGKFVNADNNVLYANHRLFLNENSWKFENVVYEGKHFAYFPLDAAHKDVKALVAKVGTEQVYGEEDKFQANGIFAVSPSYDLVGTQSGKAPVVDFELNTISNRLKINLEVANFGDITDPVILKSVKVVETTPSNSFSQKATLGDLPEVVYAQRNTLTSSSTDAAIAAANTADATATTTAFKTGIIAALGTDFADDEMLTTVKNHAGFTSTANTYAVNIFSFPVTTAPTAINVVVETNYGVITITGTEATTGLGDVVNAINTANKAAMTSLLSVLKGTHETVKFTEYGKSGAVTLKLNMAAASLPSVSASNATEWEAAVRIAGQKSVPTINVTGDITVDLTELPKTVNTINVAGDKTLTISGAVADPALEITGSVKVAASTTLNVNGTVAKPAKLTIATLDNWGEITVGENASMIVTTATNHATVINKNSFTATTFVNDKQNVTTAPTHICAGIFKNYATLNATFENDGTYYAIGANSTLNGTLDNTTGVVITEEGGDITTFAGIKKATVNTPAQMNAAVTAGATEITVTGVVSLSTALSTSTNIILKEGAELYMLTNTALGVNAVEDANASYLNITVEGAAKISAESAQDINSLTVKAAATLEILAETKLNVETLAYDVNSVITNNGLVYTISVSKNSGSWNGMAINKQIVSGNEVAISSPF